MDELLRTLQVSENVTSVASIWNVIIGSILSGLLSALVGVIYRKVHSEAGYSQALVHSLVVISMITALIMAIIGSNIARAFSLVGALSIIRFRSAIKSPFDVTVIFLCIAIGMACGTGFYTIGIVATGIITSTILIMHFTNFGSYPERTEHLLSIIFPMEVDFEKAMKPLLNKFFAAYNLSYLETLDQGKMREVVYSVKPKASTSDQDVIDQIRELNRDQKVTYKAIRHAIEVP